MEGASLVPPFRNGLIKPHSFTLARLELAEIARPKHRFFYGPCWFHNDPKFTPAVYAAASSILGSDPAAVEAVARVETSTQPTWDRMFGLPLILFERHIFAELINSRFDKEHPDVSNPARTPAGHYGRSEDQPRRLWRAAMLDETAALKSASWGTFQILGKNHVDAGYATVESFVDGMMTSRQKHLEAFVRFIRANPILLSAIRNQDWAKFANAYNGKKYYEHDYDGRSLRAFTAAKNRNATEGASR